MLKFAFVILPLLVLLLGAALGWRNFTRNGLTIWLCWIAGVIALWTWIIFGTNIMVGTFEGVATLIGMFFLLLIGGPVSVSLSGLITPLPPEPPHAHASNGPHDDGPQGPCVGKRIYDAYQKLDPEQKKAAGRKVRGALRTGAKIGAAFCRHFGRTSMANALEETARVI